ncbi:hypothetical protein [Paraburkholderia tropica]|uniref:hypothetical protein n=1 Tax=Paraburkholderia tropica TaxID=92647 RepID=UPI003D26EBE9
MNTPTRILVVFYSRSETTAELGGRLAAELEGDYERLHEVEFRRRAGPSASCARLSMWFASARRIFSRWPTCLRTTTSC